MSTTVIGLYDDAKTARRAIEALASEGFEESAIDILDGREADDVAQTLTKRGFKKTDADRYAAAVERGKALVAALVSDDEADKAADLLEQNGAVGLEDIEREEDSEEEEDNEEQDTAKTETIPVVAEGARVNKRAVNKGGVRIETSVSERPFRKTVTLDEERLAVERRAVDRAVGRDEADEAFEEKSFELTETAEEAEVVKEARVVEEVVISKQHAQHKETVEDTVRRTHVDVERVNGTADKRR